MAVSDVDGQVKGAVGRDVVVQASDVANRAVRRRVMMVVMLSSPVIDVTVALRTKSDHLMLRMRL